MMIKQCNYQKKNKFIDEGENNEVEIPFTFRVEMHSGIFFQFILDFLKNEN